MVDLSTKIRRTIGELVPSGSTTVRSRAVLRSTGRGAIVLDKTDIGLLGLQGKRLPPETFIDVAIARAQNKRPLPVTTRRKVRLQ